MVRNPTVSSNSLVVNPHVRTPTTESAQASLRASVDEFQTPLLLLREPRLDEQNYDLALLSSLHTIVFNCLVNTVVRFSELLPHAGHIMNLSLSRESSRSSAIAMITILRDMLSQGKPSQLHLVYKARSLKGLQQDIENGKIDEAL